MILERKLEIEQTQEARTDAVTDAQKKTGAANGCAGFEFIFRVRYRLTA